MDEQKKCSLKKHNEIDAIVFCQECNIYMCNKCATHHSELFENHNKYELGKENIITSLCKEKNHKAELKFYCKNHNKLCCTACISKIKGEEYGQHTDCDVCIIEKVEDEKKNKLNENIKYLENISLSIEKSMDELKNITTKIEKNKEEIKNKVSKTFTKLRNAINEREDEILILIDNLYNEYIFDEKLIKQSEKLPNKIKKLLEEAKNVENDWKQNNKKLNIFINICLDIENSIKDIKIIYENVEKCKSEDIDIEFSCKEENELNEMIKIIKNFGQILKKENEKFYIKNLNSLIINNNKKYNQILKYWINPNDIIKADLLYRLTRDGEKVSKFHELCDNKGPTLILFSTNDGNIGGIYTPLSWDTTSEYKCDTDTFMFNLNKNEKYIRNKENLERSIWCTDYFGPWTINFGFNQTMKQIEHRGINIVKAYQNGADILPNNSEEKKFFDVNEVEIYEISINNNK